MNDIWRPVVGYEGLYEVSNWGRVRSLGMWVNGANGNKCWRKGRVLKSGKYTAGYLYVALSKDGIIKHYLVHRLVGMAFPDLVGWTEDAKGKLFEELEINHKDEVKTNNCVDNLEWCDGFYNSNYGTRNERLSKKVYMYTLNNKLCGLWPSTAECNRNGFSSGSISECCNGTRKTYKSFKWSYNPPKPPKALSYFDRLP